MIIWVKLFFSPFNKEKIVEREFLAGLQLMFAAILELLGIYRFFFWDSMKVKSSFCTLFIFGNLLAFSGEIMCNEPKIYFLVVYPVMFCAWIVFGFVLWKKEQSEAGSV